MEYSTGPIQAREIPFLVWSNGLFLDSLEMRMMRKIIVPPIVRSTREKNKEGREGRKQTSTPPNIISLKPLPSSAHPHVWQLSPVVAIKDMELYAVTGVETY
jgi:hypothetical protein